MSVGLRFVGKVDAQHSSSFFKAPATKPQLSSPSSLQASPLVALEASGGGVTWPVGVEVGDRESSAPIQAGELRIPQQEFQATLLLSTRQKRKLPEEGSRQHTVMQRQTEVWSPVRPAVTPCWAGCPRRDTAANGPPWWGSDPGCAAGHRSQTTALICNSTAATSLLEKQSTLRECGRWSPVVWRIRTSFLEKNVYLNRKLNKQQWQTFTECVSVSRTVLMISCNLTGLSKQPNQVRKLRKFQSTFKV